jgi:hypothetical protein
MGRWRSWLSYLSNVHQLGKKVLSSNLGRLIFSIPNSGHNHDHQAEMHSRSLISLGLTSEHSSHLEHGSEDTSAMGRWRSWLSHLSNIPDGQLITQKVLSSNLGRLIFSIPN